MRSDLAQKNRKLSDSLVDIFLDKKINLDSVEVEPFSERNDSVDQYGYYIYVNEEQLNRLDKFYDDRLLSAISVWVERENLVGIIDSDWGEYTVLSFEVPVDPEITLPKTIPPNDYEKMTWGRTR